MEDGLETAAALVELRADEWLLIIGLGLVAGALGQVARMVVGISKAMGEAAAAGADARSGLSAGRMLVSLLIGGTAGGIAAVLTLDGVDGIGREPLLGLAAAGYAGADFIEGALKRFVPKLPPPGAGAT
ncbi:MAG: hypothetical protein AAFQ51_17990 [Pseudomonadota bacterium]